jgi:hypothetical protein
MGTTILTAPDSTTGRAVSSTLAATAALWMITAVGAIAGGLDPALALTQAPHAVLHPGIAAYSSILANNVRVLCLPILLTALGLQQHRLTRCVGDIAVAGMLTLNGLLVGVELGRWQLQLIAYLPQLPVEWLAAGFAAATWITGRNRAADRHHVLAMALAVGALLCIAAAIEVLLTPHAPWTHQ